MQYRTLQLLDRLLLVAVTPLQHPVHKVYVYINISRDFEPYVSEAVLYNFPVRDISPVKQSIWAAHALKQHRGGSGWGVGGRMERTGGNLYNRTCKTYWISNSFFFSIVFLFFSRNQKPSERESEFRSFRGKQTCSDSCTTSTCRMEIFLVNQ